MATAAGAYATLAGLRALLFPPGYATTTEDATVLQPICDRWNAWIESKTGRSPFGPVPVISTTVTANGGVGSTSVTLASATNVGIGDALMFGLVTGAHEHQVVAAAPAGNVVTLQSPLTATYANGTVVKRVQIFSGADADPTGRVLSIPGGILTIASLEVADTEYAIGGTWYLIPATDYRLWPTPLERDSGAPAFELHMSAIPSGGNPFPFMTAYEGNVRIDGAFGWAAAPDDLVAIALRLCVADYRRRGSGGGNQVTIGTDGERTIEQALSSTDWHTINRYTQKVVDII